MTDIELATAAGLFEGEGTVRINKATHRNLGNLCCSLVNTDREIVDFMQSRWPAFIKVVRPPTPRHQQPWVWSIAAKKARSFLIDIRPFVVTTRMISRIELAIDFQEQKYIGPGNRKDWMYRADQFSYYLQMRDLNARGVDQ